MIKKVAISVVAALFMTQSNATAGIIQNYTNKQISQNTKAFLSNYEVLSNDVCYSIKLALFQICEISSMQENERKAIEDFLKITQKASKTAQKRYKQRGLECDLNVLYYTLAASHILEAVLDDEFMKLTGGYKMPNDIRKFGEGLSVVS